MSCTHNHRGANHNPGDLPHECSTSCAGRVTYCGPDVDDPFRGDHLCEHEDTPSAAGTALNIPADSVKNRIGNPGAWTKYRRIPGTPEGLYRIRKISDRYFDPSPFHTQNIPCNPDQPGSVSVNETVSRTVKLSVSIGGKIKDIIDAKVGFDISQTRPISCTVTLHGEKCRSVDYKLFVRYELWEMEYIPPDDASAGKRTLRFFVPIGWWAQKEYVKPTCCAETSQSFFKTFDDRVQLEEGRFGKAEYAVGNALLRARGLIVDPPDHYSLIAAYKEALVALRDLDRDSKGGFPELEEDVRALVDDFVGASVASAASACTYTDDVNVLAPEFHEEVKEAAVLLEQARSTEGSGAAAELYHRAYHQAIAAEHSGASSCIPMDIEDLPDLDLE